MRSKTVTFALVICSIGLTIGYSSAEDPVRQHASVKIDKNLRKALLKALADLDNESAEQKSTTTQETPTRIDEIDLTPSDGAGSAKDSVSSVEPIRTIFSFDGFPNEEETPNEDKLQNSSFVEMDRYVLSDNPASIMMMDIQKLRDEATSNNRAFQAHDVILPDKSSAIYDKSPDIVYDQLETRSVKTSSIPINVETVKSLPNRFSESLAISSSNGLATANALVSPNPTESSPIALTSPKNATSKVSVSTSSSSSSTSETTSTKEEQEVKIFQAPLVAAFTVQQDERGIPKSVVPIYKPSGDGQALSLQEQLEFKQQLLERQLAELQAQQIQQTQFLLRQRQVYEEQLRQKQQQQLFIQEQSRLKQLQAEQLRIKQLEEQSRLKQLEEQRNYQLQQAQKPTPQFAQSQQSSVLSLQPNFKAAGVNIQPSFTLELPKAAGLASFQSNRDQQRFQQLRQQQLQHQQQAQLQLQQQQQIEQQRQQLLQQQRLHQSFPIFPTDFQPPSPTSALRFHRQEAFGAVGNFGINENRQQHFTGHRNNQFTFGDSSSRGVQTFIFNPHQQQLQHQQQQQYRQRPQTPAKQIQHLLYQSGVVGNLGSVQGTGGQEDLNIVSKVLALNVGALPTKNLRYNNFASTPHKA